MALDTPAATRSLVVYEVFPRNHAASGDLAGAAADLPRIRDLGVDVVWLMPVHPVGEVRRKGPAGSPYAIRDHRAVDPALGGETALAAFLEAAHRLGLRVLLDIVFNHASPDSVLLEAHPDWFWRREDGTCGNRFGDWYDVVDFAPGHPDLQEYLLGTLEKWAAFGCDGFRCDVASFLPAAFWREARRRVAAIRPGCLWLAECVHPASLLWMRAAGHEVLSDGELFQSFDMLYEYDAFEAFEAWLRDGAPLAAWLGRVADHEHLFPGNYAKLRFVENHDTPRAAAVFPEPLALRNHTAFRFFCKGPALLYAGQERALARRPDLFAPDPLDWTAGDPGFTPFIAALCRLKKHPLAGGAFSFLPSRGPAVAAQLVAVPDGKARLVGCFRLERGAPAPGETLPVPLADGPWPDLVSGETRHVRDGCLPAAELPLIVEN